MEFLAGTWGWWLALWLIFGTINFIVQFGRMRDFFLARSIEEASNVLFSEFGCLSTILGLITISSFILFLIGVIANFIMK